MYICSRDDDDLVRSFDKAFVIETSGGRREV